MDTLSRYTMGPRTTERRRTYAERRARLGGPDGRNMMVDMARTLAGKSMVRRANRAKAGSSAAGKARQAGRGQTEPLLMRARAANYGMTIVEGGPEVEYDRIVGGTNRQLRQLLRMGERTIETARRRGAERDATPQRPRRTR